MVSNLRRRSLQSFYDARRRCEDPRNPTFPDYGGRGIKFLYASPEEFLRDVGVKPTREYTIDRINNDGHYEPGNCRWATRKEQSLNRSDNHYLTYNGETLTVKEWRDKLGRPIWSVRRALSQGWNVGQILGFEPKPSCSFRKISFEDRKLIQATTTSETIASTAQKYSVCELTIRRILKEDLSKRIIRTKA